MSKKYYWLKLKEDFFRDKKIKKLRKIAGGDTYTIIYLKMQLLSLKNSGALIYEGVEEDFAEEIALEIDEDVDNVKVTLIFLMKNGLLEEVEQDHYIMTETIQCIGKESDSAERVRRHRALKKEKAKELENNSEDNKSVTCNGVVTTCNTEIEKEKREKKKENKSKDIYYENETLNSLFLEFLELRKKLKAVNSDRAINTLIKQLNEYPDDIKYKMIETSIVNSWKSVYPLKTNKVNASNNYKRNEIVPDWLNKDIPTEKANEKEINDMNELLKEYKDPDFEERKAALQEKLRNKYGKR